jgi:hypothetical protein
MLQPVRPAQPRRPLQTLAHRALIAAALPLCLTSAVAQTARPSLDALRAACSDDAARLCSNVPSGGGRVVACLKQHQDQLSNKCRQAAGLPPLPTANPESTPDAQPAPSIASPALALPTPPSPDSTTPTPPAAASQPTHVAGETFVRRTITDPAHGNAVAATIHIPEKWTLDGKVEWHYDKVENPLVFSVHAVNPANAEGFFLYPLLRFQSTEVAPQYRQYMRGQQSAPIQHPLPALVAFVKRTRPDVTNLKFIGQQDLPNLAKALNLAPFPGDHGVAVKVSYDLNGQPVEEAFFGVYYISQGGNEAKTVGQMSMPANAIKQTNWGFRALQSFRAPAGTLDAHMAVFCLIAKSMVMNPQWLQLAKQVHDQLTAAFNQNLQKGYDQIRAGQAAMQQMQAQENATDASVAKFDTSLRTTTYNDNWLRTSGSGGGSADHLSTTDRASNNMRLEDTAKDPTTGENVQLSNAGSYHFTDGFGNYRTSDDPNYTPEKNGESGSWTPMSVVQ